MADNSELESSNSTQTDNFSRDLTHQSTINKDSKSIAGDNYPCDNCNMSSNTSNPLSYSCDADSDMAVNSSTTPTPDNACAAALDPSLGSSAAMVTPHSNFDNRNCEPSLGSTNHCTDSFDANSSEGQTTMYCHGDNTNLAGDLTQSVAVDAQGCHGDCEIGDNLTRKDSDSEISLKGFLRKDDSGIVVERSPVKECIASPECASAADTSSENLMVPSRPSVSNESEGLVADYDSDEDDNDDEKLKESDRDSDGNASCKIKPRSDSDLHDNDDATDDRPDNEDEISDDMENIRISRSALRQHNRYLLDVSDLSSSSDSEDEGDTAARRRGREPAEEEEEVTVDLTPPRDTWSPLASIFSRELGFSSHMPHAVTFRRQCTASVNLVQRLDLHKKLESHEGCVNSLHFNKQGTILASGSDDQNIVIWNWVEGRPHFYFYSGHRSNVFQSKFMPYCNDTHLVSCARDGQVRLAELSSLGACKSTKKLVQHKGAAHKLALLQDSSHVFYSCGEDAVVFEIDLRQENHHKLVTTKAAENDRRVALYSIHSNPFKSHEFCVGGRDHFIRIYDKRMINESSNHGVFKQFCPHHLMNSELKANVTCAVYNYNGTEVMGTYNDEDIYLFNAEHSDGANYIHKYTGHRNNATVKGVNFYGPHSEFIVSGSDCSNVFLWHKDTEKVVQYFHADDGGVVNVLEPHPHAPLLATSGLDHDIKLWMPTAEPTNLKGLKEQMKRNRKDRADERVETGEDFMDGHMFWLLMQHLRRQARHRREGGSGSSPSPGDSDDDDNDDDDDDDDDADNEDAEESEGRQVQCVQS